MDNCATTQYQQSMAGDCCQNQKRAIFIDPRIKNIRKLLLSSGLNRIVRLCPYRDKTSDKKNITDFPCQA